MNDKKVYFEEVVAKDYGKYSFDFPQSGYSQYFLYRHLTNNVFITLSVLQHKEQEIFADIIINGRKFPFCTDYYSKRVMSINENDLILKNTEAHQIFTYLKQALSDGICVDLLYDLVIEVYRYDGKKHILKKLYLNDDEKIIFLQH